MIRVDHVLLVMGPIENDARTLNLAQTLIKAKNSVLIIGLGTKTELRKETEYVSIQTVSIQNVDRMFKLWYAFGLKLVSFLKSVKSKNYWAMDLYSLPFAVFGSRKVGRVLYDSREVYSALGMNLGHPIKQQILTEIERFFIKKADVVFTSGKMDSEYLSKLYSIEVPSVIMNLPNEKNVLKTDKLRSHFAIPSDKKIMIYQGMIHPGRGLEPFIKVLSNFPNWVLCILGSGRYWQNINQEINRLGVSEQVYKSDPVPYTELAEWTSSADAGLCYIEPLTESLRLALPNKFFEYAMAGIPIVCSDLPQLKPIMKEFENGVLLNNNATIEEWKNCIAKLSDSNSYQKMQIASQNVAKRYSWQAQEKSIFEMI